MGPFYVIYMQLRGLDKSAFRATIATIFLLDGTVRVVGYALGGLFHGGTLWLVVWSLPLMAAGLYVGGHIHTTISQQTFRHAIAALLLLSGAVLLFGQL